MLSDTPNRKRHTTKVEGKVFSGDVFTTVFNTARNALMFGAMLEGLDVKFLIKGDDGVVFYKPHLENQVRNRFKLLTDKKSPFSIELNFGPLLSFDFCSLQIYKTKGGDLHVDRSITALNDKFDFTTSQQCFVSRKQPEGSNSSYHSMISNVNTAQNLLRVIGGYEELIHEFSSEYFDVDNLDKEDKIKHAGNAGRGAIALTDEVLPLAPTVSYHQFFNNNKARAWFEVNCIPADSLILWIERRKENQEERNRARLSAKAQRLRKQPLNKCYHLSGLSSRVK